MNKRTIQISIQNPTRYEYMYSTDNKKSLVKRRRDYKERIHKLLVILDCMRENIWSDEGLALFKGNPPINWITSSISRSGSQLDPEGEMVLLNGSGDSTLFEEWLSSHQLEFQVFDYQV